MKRSFLVFTLLTLSLGCGDGVGTEFTVDHFQQKCTGEGLLNCLNVVAGGEEIFFSDPIEGFTHEWGHRYRLRVLVEHIADPPQDGSSLRYTLLETLSDETVPLDTEFTLSIGSDFVSKGDEGYSISDGPEFVCAEPSVCDDLDSFLEDEFRFSVLFTYGETSHDDPLIALDVLGIPID